MLRTLSATCPPAVSLPALRPARPGRRNAHAHRPARRPRATAPLEPWQAPEFLAHIDRARPLVDPWIPWASLTTDLATATATLQRYADLSSADNGRIYGIWLDGVLVGGVMFTRFDTSSGCASSAAGWRRPGRATGS
ncbi:hypothetical protein [Streptomyces nitrosporeus]|uniref:hypothetical protein n=1 Tax=Streptomyces nitrosporeus TaxID=28894 RepID=UPI001FCBB901|nr:hypothetical protein [Streptomyces nitrosporeus]